MDIYNQVYLVNTIIICTFVLAALIQQGIGRLARKSNLSEEPIAKPAFLSRFFISIEYHPIYS
jgi:hypothetical protein